LIKEPPIIPQIDWMKKYSDERIALIQRKDLPQGGDEKNPQLALAALATEGNVDAREKISAMLKPVIGYQNRIFCQQFCRQNRFQFQCSVDKSWRNPQADATQCEWGEHSYQWMYQELMGNNCLLKFNNRHGDTLFDYLLQIINSLDFYQHWKDWRFFNHDKCPESIQQLGPVSIKIFSLLKEKRKLNFIIQKSGLSREEVENKTRRIMQLLLKEKQLNSLDYNTINGLPKDDNRENNLIKNLVEHKIDTVENNTGEKDRENFYGIWLQLNTIEQYILQALLIENQHTDDILHALTVLDIRIKEGVLPEDTNRQHLLAFKDEVLEKLSSISRPVF